MLPVFTEKLLINKLTGKRLKTRRDIEFNKRHAHAEARMAKVAKKIYVFNAGPRS
jgi:hypothetical protein